MSDSYPFEIVGGLAIDDRGMVGFCNEFDFTGVRRSYWLRNHKVGFVRAWHGHKREGKYITVVNGTAIIAGIRLDRFDWFGNEFDFKDEREHGRAFRTVLSAIQPRVVYIPPGWANGSMALADDTIIMHYSTVTLDESGFDDIRFLANRFSEIWEIENR